MRRAEDPEVRLKSIQDLQRDEQKRLKQGQQEPQAEIQDNNMMQAVQTKKLRWSEGNRSITLYHLTFEEVEELEKQLAYIKQESGFGHLGVEMKDGYISHFLIGIDFLNNDDLNDDRELPRPRTTKQRAKQQPKFLRLADGRQFTFQHLPFPFIKWLDERIGLIKNNGGFGILKAEVEYGGIREVDTHFTEILPE